MEKARESLRNKWKDAPYFDETAFDVALVEWNGDYLFGHRIRFELCSIATLDLFIRAFLEISHEGKVKREYDGLQRPIVTYTTLRVRILELLIGSKGNNDRLIEKEINGHDYRMVVDSPRKIEELCPVLPVKYTKTPSANAAWGGGHYSI